MIHALDNVRAGFSVEADAVVVGSGAGGAVVARNLAEAGMRTVVLEAGPQVTPREMTRNAPLFLARYYWEGGMRLSGGDANVPVMQGRMLGGSTVVNSAIMFALPGWVREDWRQQEGLSWLEGPAFDRAFERVFAATRTAPTPLAVMGKRNLAVRDALEAAGIPSKPLPRAVDGCGGCGDCLIGCARGAKQSVDRSYLPTALQHGAQVFTCAQAEQIITTGGKATGVRGWVVDPMGRLPLAPFEVRAPRVFMAAGAINTPALLQQSGLRGKHVGKHLAIHMTCGSIGVMEERIDPWFGATQGWGAISAEIQGLKYESLWAPPSAIMVRWGDVGERFYDDMEAVKHAVLLAVVYRGRVTGDVRTRGGLEPPRIRLWMNQDDVQVLMRGLKRGIDGLLATGARYVHTGLPGIPERITSTEDSEQLLHRRIRARDISMTGNHVFGSCRMSASPKRGAVDPEGRLYGVEGVYVCDASLFPSPSAVNPQATIMALADVISRRAAELSL